MTTRTAPLVSVLMPAYNAEAFLTEAVASVLSQTYENLELIVVDDGSEDATANIVAAIKDPRLKVISRSHEGLSGARNHLLSLARGELLAWMDADDISVRERLARQVEFLQTTPDVSVVGTWAASIDSKGKVCPMVAHQPPIEDVAIRGEMLRTNCFVNGSVMFRQRAVRSVRFHSDLAPAEDYDFWMRMLDWNTVHNLPETLYYYRLHSSSATGKLGTSRLLTLASTIQESAVTRLIQPPPASSEVLETDRRVHFKNRLGQDQRVLTMWTWIWSAVRSRRWRVAAQLFPAFLRQARNTPKAWLWAGYTTVIYVVRHAHVSKAVWDHVFEMLRPVVRDAVGE
jgi:Glycosyl transferase family 2